MHANQLENSKERKKELLNAAWMWFSRFNVGSIIVAAYLWFTWMQQDPLLKDLSVYLQVAIVLSAMAILFIVHYTVIFPFFIIFYLIVFIMAPSFTTTPIQVFAFIFLELGIIVLSLPIATYHVKLLDSDKQEDVSHVAENSDVKENNHDNEYKDLDDELKELLLKRIITGVEVVLFSLVGFIFGIVFFSGFSTCFSS